MFGDLGSMFMDFCGVGGRRPCIDEIWGQCSWTFVCDLGDDVHGFVCDLGSTVMDF